LEGLQIHDHHRVNPFNLKWNPPLKYYYPIVTLENISSDLEYGSLEVPLLGILAFTAGWKIDLG